MKYFWNRRQLDLERELRARRPRPRPEFVETLAVEVRSRPAERSHRGRVGLALAMSGLIVVVLASFGGIGYASSEVSRAVKKPTAAHPVRAVHVVHLASPSAAQVQYGSVTPPTKNPPLTPPPSNPSKPTGGTGGTSGGTASSSGSASGTEGTSASSTPSQSSSNLPFTGLALWVPLAIGLALIAMGLVLRTRGRRRDSGAAS